MKKTFVLFALLASTTATLAAEKAPPIWSGAVNLGMLRNTGNSSAYSYNAQTDVSRKKLPWETDLSALGQLGGSHSGLTTRRYVFSAQQKYYFEAPIQFVYLNSNYQYNSFSSYTFQWVTSLGYGSRIYKSASVTIDAQVGPGYVRYKESGNGTHSSLIAYGEGNLTWNLNKNVNVTQSISAWHGAANDNVQSISALNTKLIGNIGMQLSYTVEYNSHIPASSSNTHHTDTITSISLVYSF